MQVQMRFLSPIHGEPIAEMDISGEGKIAVRPLPTYIFTPESLEAMARWAVEQRALIVALNK